MLKDRERTDRRHVEPPQGGFTLIELLVTIIVLAIVITSLSSLYYQLQINQVQSQHYDVAVRTARTEIEDLRNNGYDTLTPGTNINFASLLPSNFPAGATATAAISQPTSGLMRVDATITYSDFGQTETVTLSSDIGIIGIGQG
ncbi:MAG TPA: prepilin-type N-terminal cleavage/methylation domain-containing protein [Candidatus Saccharimonadales bacterium]|nr:prepilin-type N-terminal cleavage/methylation domain-containing protein [Candidatus Saccharimonadales bacterium]